MKIENGIARFDPARDGKTLFLPKEATRAVFDADFVNRLISFGFEHIEAEAGNPHFTLKNGCLLDGEILLLTEKGATMSEGMGIKRISDFSFPCYEKREILRIPEGVEEVGLDVFRGKIKRVYLPASLKFMHEGAFRHTLEIEEIVIGDNPYFCMENGCLIDKERKTLLYAVGNTVIIPDGVKRIGRLAFLDHRFQKIVIPSSVEEIGEQNFFYFDRSADPHASPYIRATHAKIFVAMGSYAEKFFLERGSGDDIVPFPKTWKILI